MWSPSASALSRRAFRPEDLYRLTSPGEPQYSPDGQLLVYVVAGLDETADGYRADLHVCEASGGPARLLVRGLGRLRRPMFAPTGDRIAYIDGTPGEAAQLWILDLREGGQPTRLTMGGEVSDFTWDPHGSEIAYCALAPGVDPRARKVREFTRIPIAVDGIGVLEPQGASLYIVDLSTKQVRAVAAGPFTYRLPVWSPDGLEIAVTRLVHYELARARGGELVLFTRDGHLVRSLADDVNWQQPPAIAWSPDSGRIAYCTADPHLSGMPPRVMQIARDGSRRLALTERHDRFPSQGVVSDTRPGAGPSTVRYGPDGRWVYYTAGDRGSVPLFRCATDGSGAWEQVTPAHPHCVAEFCLSPDGQIAYVSQTDTEPDQIWILDGGQPRQLSDTAREFWSQFIRVPMRRFTVRPDHGPEADAWIQLPTQGSAPYPAILTIHGGPHGMFGYCMVSDVQGWLDEGWAVIQVNPPGSAGYGFEFARAVWHDWGGVDYDYHMLALDECAQRGWIDPHRIAVTGTSYGGFMVNTMLTRTDRFVCAVAENAPSDLISGFGTSDLGLLYERPHVGGVPWRESQKYWDRSPISNVAKVRTPILILTAEEDRRQPPGQSEEWFTALLVEGKKAVLVRYPHESHFWRLNGRPSNRVHRLRRVRAWFTDHLGVL